MFGMNRRKGTNAAIAAIRPLLGIQQTMRGIPPGFWDDNYVIGFVCFTAVFHAKRETNNRLKEDKLFYAVSDALTATSNLNGEFIFQKYSNTALENPKNPDFERACDNAALLNFYVAGIVKDEGKHEDIVKGREFAKQYPDNDFTDGTERSKVAVYLATKYWNDELKQRFGTD